MTITQILTLYLLDWVHISKHNEYRVFVHNKRIIAISQQHLYNVFTNLDNDIENNERLTMIYNYFEGNIKDTITHIDSYVYDFAILDTNIPYFIEPCPFGKEHAAGSALFHWLLDEDILYEKDQNNIYFRYTVT